MTEKNVEAIVELIEILVSIAFNDGISAGHPMSTRGDSDVARADHKERINEIRLLMLEAK